MGPSPVRGGRGYSLDSVYSRARGSLDKASALLRPVASYTPSATKQARTVIDLSTDTATPTGPTPVPSDRDSPEMVQQRMTTEEAAPAPTKALTPAQSEVDDAYVSFGLDGCAGWLC